MKEAAYTRCASVAMQNISEPELEGGGGGEGEGEGRELEREKPRLRAKFIATDGNATFSKLSGRQLDSRVLPCSEWR